MTGFDDQLKNLNQKLQLLLKQYQHLQKENAVIKKEIDDKRLLIKEKNEVIQKLQENIDVLKLTSSSLMDASEKKTA